MTEIKEIKNLSDITQDKGNANEGTERGQYMIEASMRDVGAGRSILVDKHGRVIAGNKSVENWAAIAELEDIEVVRTDGKKLVVVQREDLDLYDAEDDTARKAAYYDNRASEVGLKWSADAIKADIDTGVQMDGFFFQEEIDYFVQAFNVEHAGDFLNEFLSPSEQEAGEEDDAGGDDGFANPYVRLDFPCTTEQRDRVIGVINKVKEHHDLSTSLDALLTICEAYESEYLPGPA